MNAFVEEWRQTRFRNYDVSNFGRVRHRWRRNILTGWLTANGYNRVCLRENGRNVMYLVHRLVGEAFLNLRANQAMHHIDNNGTNNRLDNLEAVTQGENLRHAAKQGRIRGGSKLTDDQARALIEAVRLAEGPLVHIAAKFGISTTHVRRLREGKCWKHLL